MLLARITCHTCVARLKKRLSTAALYLGVVEAYGEAVSSERSCEWFQKFRNGQTDVEGNEHIGKLLEEDLCQTQEELALTLRGTQQLISHPLKSLGRIQDQGNWVPYELDATISLRPFRHVGLR
ncbi:histone-lysine N-methyltransferase SETMAR [Trichonephila clavipes]|nr:histone-lysine N-methyltransferase SETMAR [Trichonephila clavipes]